MPALDTALESTYCTTFYAAFITAKKSTFQQAHMPALDTALESSYCTTVYAAFVTA